MKNIILGILIGIMIVVSYNTTINKNKYTYEDIENVIEYIDETSYHMGGWIEYEDGVIISHAFKNGTYVIEGITIEDIVEQGTVQYYSILVKVEE